MNNSVEKIFEKEEFSKGVIVCLKMCISTLASDIANAAQAIQEADLTPTITNKSKVKFKYLNLFLFYDEKFRYFNLKTKLYLKFQLVLDAIL